MVCEKILLSFEISFCQTSSSSLQLKYNLLDVVVSVTLLSLSLLEPVDIKLIISTKINQNIPCNLNKLLSICSINELGASYKFFKMYSKK